MTRNGIRTWFAGVRGSQARFCRQHDIPTAALSSWLAGRDSRVARQMRARIISALVAEGIIPDPAEARKERMRRRNLIIFKRFHAGKL